MNAVPHPGLGAAAAPSPPGETWDRRCYAPIVSVSPEDLRQTLLARARAGRAADDARRDGAIAAARRVLRAAAEAGQPQVAWLIGSAAWGGFGARSDLDVVVQGLTVRAAIELGDHIAAEAGIAVDVLRWEELPPAFQARVQRHGIPLA